MIAPTVALDELIAAVTAYVDPHTLPDAAPTGLQVRGAPDGTPVAVTRVALAVTASRSVIEAAAAWDAHLLLVHHGLFWGTTDPEYDPEFDPAVPNDEARVALLQEHGLSLAAYHLPLDAHPEVGNNAELARLLGLDVDAFDLFEIPETGVHLGLTATSATPLSAAQLAQRAETALKSQVWLVPGKPEGIQRVGIISGGGTRDLYAALDRGLDAFITGEGREWAYHLARESGITFLVLGHHASERYGVQALGAWIARRYQLAVRFFDEENPF